MMAWMKAVNLQLGISIQDIKRVNNTVATIPMTPHTALHFPSQCELPDYTDARGW
jgi:hypothetical protein